LTDKHRELSGIVNLDALKNLRQLGIVVPIAERVQSRDGVVLDIAKVLSTARALENRIEIISLEIIAVEKNPWLLTRAQDWAAVVHEAGRLSMGGGLLFEVKMRGYDSDYGSGRALESARRDLFAYIDKAFQEALVSYGHVEYRSVHLM
jgi:hypothetical protein